MRIAEFFKNMAGVLFIIAAYGGVLFIIATYEGVSAVIIHFVSLYPIHTFLFFMSVLPALLSWIIASDGNCRRQQ